MLLGYLATMGSGWRFTWHVCLHDAMDYGGVYTPPEELEAAARRYRVLGPIGVLIGAGVASVGWWV